MLPVSNGSSRDTVLPGCMAGAKVQFEYKWADCKWCPVILQERSALRYTHTHLHTQSLACTADTSDKTVNIDKGDWHISFPSHCAKLKLKLPKYVRRQLARWHYSQTFSAVTRQPGLPYRSLCLYTCACNYKQSSAVNDGVLTYVYGTKLKNNTRNSTT